MVDIKYANAYSEILEILKYLTPEDYEIKIIILIMIQIKHFKSKMYLKLQEQLLEFFLEIIGHQMNKGTKLLSFSNKKELELKKKNKKNIRVRIYLRIIMKYNQQKKQH